MNDVTWNPTHPTTTHMWKFMRFVEPICQKKLMNYQDLYTWSIANSTQFWQALCDYFQLSFTTPAHSILNTSQEMIDARWFEGATFNFAEKLLSGRDDQIAIVSLDESGLRRELTYKNLRHQVHQCAAGLKKAGVIAGDRVAAIMPNVDYTVIAMLATASIGAIWSSCSSDFGPEAAIDRLGQIEPKVLFVCDEHDYHGKNHIEWAKTREISNRIQSLHQIVICPRIAKSLDLTEIPNSIMWHDFLQPTTQVSYEAFPFNHPLYILFSSGTTGKPKCIIHSTGGTWLQHIKELGLHTDIHEHDNLLFYTTCGWMMWNWMVSTLALGATITLYEGSPTWPDNTRLFQILETEKITVFGTSPKFLATIQHAKYEPRQEFPLQHLRCILSTGAPLLPEQYDFVTQHIKSGVQICSISGGTDIISCFALGNPLLPVIRGELQCIGLGMSLEIYDESGHPVHETRGELVCTKPFPSMPIGFWNDPDKRLYRKSYFSRFPNVWAHGDFAETTAHHGVIIYGRSDAVLNPGGVRIGTAEIYRQVEKVPMVLDSVVIGQEWQNDIRIILFVKLCAGQTLTSELESTIRQTIRSNASPRHVPAKILQVTDIPRTISGKVVEIAVRQIVQGQPVSNMHSLANPEALKQFADREELQTT